MAESRIVNEPRSKNPLVKAIRELLEHRALWLYLLTDEAAKAGADPAAFAPAAVKRLFQGAGLVREGRRHEQPEEPQEGPVRQACADGVRDGREGRAG